jgi:hypothetical protein
MRAHAQTTSVALMCGATRTAPRSMTLKPLRATASRPVVLAIVLRQALRGLSALRRVRALRYPRAVLACDVDVRLLSLHANPGWRRLRQGASSLAGQFRSTARFQKHRDLEGGLPNPVRSQFIFLFVPRSSLRSCPAALCSCVTPSAESAVCRRTAKLSTAPRSVVRPGLLSEKSRSNRHRC